MGKLSKSSMLCSLIIAMLWTLGALTDARKYRIHFYVQDYLSGPNQSVYEIARSNITATSPTLFGLVRAVDDKATFGPNPNSREVGRVQGLVTFADFEDIAPNMDLNVVFKDERYNGSVLCLLGKNPASQQYRELAIVGGTGVFGMARGKVISSTYSSNTTTGHFVLEYTLCIVVDDDQDFNMTSSYNEISEM